MDRRKKEYKEKFEQFIKDVMAEYEAVGLAITVVDKDDILYENYFGYRDAFQMSQSSELHQSAPSSYPRDYYVLCRQVRQTTKSSKRAMRYSKLFHESWPVQAHLSFLNRSSPTLVWHSP